MNSFLIYSQYLENYGTRFKPKGGRAFVVDAPCVFSALALVQQHLFTEQVEQAERGETPTTEFPIAPDYTIQHEFPNASAAIAQIAEHERDDNVRLVWRTDVRFH